MLNLTKWGAIPYWGLEDLTLQMSIFPTDPMFNESPVKIPIGWVGVCTCVHMST